MSTEMKKLIIGGTEYEIVDDAGRTRITALEQGGGGSGSGLTQTEKNYILALFEKAAYAENDAEAAYTALSNLWAGYSVTWSGTGYTKSNGAASVESGRTFTSTVTANTGFTITNVTATMGGNTVQGAWSNGTVTIPNVTGDIVITVTTSQITATEISAVYTQSGGVYETTSLDDLKSDLVVTATFLDGTTGIINPADYTLSGTLSVGTSTVTVSYSNLTTTFNVMVTVYVPTPVYSLSTPTAFSGSANDAINTNIILQPSTGYDTDWTIAFELVDDANAAGKIFDFGYSSNWNQHFAYVQYAADRNRWRAYMAGAGGNTAWVSKAAGTKRFVYTHTAGVATVAEYQKRGENTVETATISRNFSHGVNEQIQAVPIIIGGFYDADNSTVIDPANGVTINSFMIYRDVLDASAITDFLENGVS